MDQKFLADFEELCSGVGRIVILWALAEQALNGCVSAMFEEYGGKKLQPDPPRALKNKIAFVRKCLRTIPELSNYMNDGLKLVQRFSEQKEYRHNLVHASPANLKSHSGVFEFISLDYTGPKLGISPITVNVADFPRIAKELEDLGKDALQFGVRLLDGRPNT